MPRPPVALAAAVVAAAVVLVWMLTADSGILVRRGPVGNGPPVAGARGRLVFIREGDIWTYELTRGLERRLTRDGGASTPQWSGGGTWVSFERAGRLWVIRADGAGLAIVAGGDRPATARWGPGAARLAYVSSDGSLNLFDPAQPDRGPRALLPAGSNVGPRIAWSHNGERIAYERRQPAGGGQRADEIWSVAVSGREPTPVSTDPGSSSLSLCCWTADDSYVLYWQMTGAAPAVGDGRPLYMARVGGARSIQVAEAVLLHPGWVNGAPRSDIIAAVVGADPRATAGKSLLAFGPPAGRPGGADVLSGPPRLSWLVDAEDRAPAWPDWGLRGEILAYSDGVSLAAAGGDLAASLAGRRIWLIRPDGRGRRQLLPDATVPAEVSDERPMWARDGRTVLFARRLQPAAAASAGADQPAPGEVELWVAHPDGNVARRIVGGIPDPGAGTNGVADWDALFSYHRG